MKCILNVEFRILFFFYWQQLPTGTPKKGSSKVVSSVYNQTSCVINPFHQTAGRLKISPECAKCARCCVCLFFFIKNTFKAETPTIFIASDLTFGWISLSFFLKCSVCTAVVWLRCRVSHLAALLTQVLTCFSTFALFFCIKPNLSSSRNGDLWPTALCNLSTSRLTVVSFFFLSRSGQTPTREERENTCQTKQVFFKVILQ